MNLHHRKFLQNLALFFLLFNLNPVGAESLYRPNDYQSLISDQKAFRVGDVLTVMILENSSATTNTDTTTRRKNGLAATYTAPSDTNKNLALGVTGDFDGGGKTQRAGKLLAQLTVTVKQVLANGSLYVAGEQQLSVNGEQQRINIEGQVRPQDISDGNVVLSTRLANAKMTYIGEGDLAERQKRSWWRELVDWIGF